MRQLFSRALTQMWFDLLEQDSLISLPDKVCAIRRHAGQMTHQNTRSGALLDDNVNLFEDFGRKTSALLR